MKSIQQNGTQSTENNSDQPMIAESELNAHLNAEVTGDTGAEWTPDTGATIGASIGTTESTDAAPYTALSQTDTLTDNLTDTLDVPFPFLPNATNHKENLRDLSAYAETLDIPVVFPVRDLGIKKALRKAADWAIEQREYKLEWIAFAAGAYACAYVFSGLIESLKHLPFKP
jgi:hypothetical protein